MNRAEVRQLLAVIAMGDNRAVDETAEGFWAGMVDDLRYDDAVWAVREHFRTSPDYLQPAHVRRGAQERAQGRADAAVRQREADLERALLPRVEEGALFGAAHEPGSAIVGHVLAALGAARARKGGNLGRKTAGDVAEKAARAWLKAHRPDGLTVVERLNPGCGRSGCPCTHGRDPKTGVTCEGGWVEDTRPDANPAGAASRCPTCAPERAKVLADAPTLPAAARQLRAMTKPAER